MTLSFSHVPLPTYGKIKMQLATKKKKTLFISKNQYLNLINGVSFFFVLESRSEVAHTALGPSDQVVAHSN